MIELGGVIVVLNHELKYNGGSFDGEKGEILLDETNNWGREIDPIAVKPVSIWSTELNIKVR